MSTRIARRRRRLRAGARAVDVRMMQRALQLARDAAIAGEVPVGAVVYDDTGAVLGEAANRREASTDPSDHAEVVAMRLAAKARGEWRLTGCSLAVTLEPCPMCAGACVNARIERIMYGATDPKAGACHSLYSIPQDTRLNHRPQVVGGILREASVRLLRAFFRARRKAARESR